jgi:hypothetical protein
MNEKDILAEAVEQLTQKTGITADWNLLPQTNRDQGVDAEFIINVNGKEIRMFAEVKGTLQPYQLTRIIQQAENHHPLLVVAEQIYPVMKEMLRKKGIGYLDTAGNIYLHAGDHMIWIDGQKPNKQKEPTANRAFTRIGLQAVFYLLQHPEAINDPYRQLAERTGAALGNIGYIIDGLEAAGHILQLDKNRKALVKRKTLMDRWIEGYRDTLRPALYLGNFRLANANTFYDREGMIGRAANTVWGGEPAAEILTHYLQPGVLIAYTAAGKLTLMQNWKLIPDTKGNIHIYRKFWEDPKWDEQHIAPPLLIYADLILTNDPRNMETGNLIYHQYLENELE